MPLKTVKKYYIGDALPNKWASVYNYKPQTPEIVESKGEIFAVINLVSEVKEFSAGTAGNLLVDCLHENYFESKKQDVTGALSAAFTAVQDRLAQLLAYEEKVAEKGVDFNLAALVIRDNEVYFASLGSHKIFLLPFAEAEEVIDITKALRDPFGKGIVKIGSSFSQVDQRFLLTTSALAAELDKEEIRSTLYNFSDAEIKEREYKDPEEIAAFMIGLDLMQSDIQPVASIENQFDTEPLIAENRNDLPAYVPEGLPQGAFATETYDAASDELSEYSESYPSEFVEETVSAEDGNEQMLENASSLQDFDNVYPEEMSAKEQLGLLKSKLQTAVKALPQKIRAYKGQYEDRKKVRDLQRQRELASTGAENPLNIGGPARISPRSSEAAGSQSTFQVVLARIKERLLYYKDIFLYDILQVNQGPLLSRGSRVFPVIVVVGILIAIFIVYSIISNVGAARERDNQIAQATDSLSFIRREIDRLSTSPVLNSNSFADTVQREQLLREVNTVEQRFTSQFDLLPADSVDTERNRLTNLKQVIQKIKKPSLSLLFDAANIFEGSISDMVQVGDNLYLLDSQNGKIYRQPITGGSAEVVVEGLESPTSIAADSNGEIIVYDNNPSSTISLVNPATKTISRVAGVSKSQLPDVDELAVYATNNSIYTVSEAGTAVNILRRSGRNYSLPSVRYNASALSGATGIEDISIVDGKIILLINGIGLVRVETTDARIEAFSGVLQAIKSADVLSFDEDYFYLGNSATGKVYVFTRTRDTLPISDFVAELELNGLSGPITEISASRSANLVWVSTNSKVYTFARSAIVN